MSLSTSSASVIPTAVLLEEPALPPPKGLVPHVTNRSDEQMWYFLCATLCTIVPGVLLLLRLYTKLYVVRTLDLADFIVVAAFLFFLAMIIIGRETLAEGAAVHMWNLQLKHFIKMQYWLYVEQIIYAPTIFLVKTAILLQYLRLLAPTKTVNPALFIGARAIIAITLVYYTISTSITIFACSPRERIWNTLITEGHCLNNNIGVLITCLYNIIVDTVILVLPARSVWRLRIPRRRKIGIVLLFAIGLLACIANAMIFYHTFLMGGDNADVSYNAAWQGCWAFAEISLGLIVTCTLYLPKFVEAKGTQLRGAFSNVMRPLVKTGSDASTPDRPMMDQIHSETDLASNGTGVGDLEAYALHDEGWSGFSETAKHQCRGRWE